jgi:hypothetical protein
VEEETQTITLPHSVVQDLKETAWQVDLSVPELLSLIVQEATYKNLDTKKDMDKAGREGWKQLGETIFQKPHKVLGQRRRKVREETPAEDGHWVSRADGSLTLSLPIPKFRRDILREMGRVRGVSPEEEVARIVQEAIKHDYKPKSEAEWDAQQKVMMRELWQGWRDIFRHIWSGGKRQ